MTAETFGASSHGRSAGRTVLALLAVLVMVGTGAIESASMNTSHQIARPDQTLEARETEGIIQLALRELSDEQRELVVLRDVQQLSYEEIQEVTGLVPGTVKSRLHRARLALVEKVKRLSHGERTPPESE